MPELGRTCLYRSDGSRRPDAEVQAEAGHIGLRLALLDEAMHARAAAEDAEAVYPPRVFLSYKWGTQQQNAWVADLAQRLEQHGCEVVFDRERDESVDRTVEAFVSRLLICRVFVAVLTHDYVVSAFEASRPTWVFDEMQCALLARPRMKLIGLVPPDAIAAAAPPPVAPQVTLPRMPAIVVHEHGDPRLDDVYRVRDAAELERVLDATLSYRGPKLTADESAWVAERLAHAEDEAVAREIITRFPFVAGAWRRLVVSLRDRGALAEALAATEQALEAVNEPLERRDLGRERILLAARCGDRRGAARAATQLIEASPHDGIAHYQLGSFLDDCGDLWGARNHLKLACRSEPEKAEHFNTLAVVYMGLGLLALAAQALERALELDPDLAVAQRNLERVKQALATSARAGATEVQGPLPGCSKCDAIFFPHPDKPLHCASCGASRTVELCELCGSDAFTPIVRSGDKFLPARCPICRTGMVCAKPRAAL